MFPSDFSETLILSLALATEASEAIDASTLRFLAVSVLEKREGQGKGDAQGVARAPERGGRKRKGGEGREERGRGGVDLHSAVSDGHIFDETFRRCLGLPEQFQELDSPGDEFRSVFSCTAQCSVRHLMHLFLQRCLVPSRSAETFNKAPVPMIAEVMLCAWCACGRASVPPLDLAGRQPHRALDEDPRVVFALQPPLIVRSSAV